MAKKATPYKIFLPKSVLTACKFDKMGYIIQIEKGFCQKWINCLKI